MLAYELMLGRTSRGGCEQKGGRHVRVTLKDIADEAGVSLMTVSNVVNGNRARVSQRTIDRVQAIVDARAYVPSASARSLAANTS